MNIALNLVLALVLASGFVMPETIPVAMTGMRDCTESPPKGPFTVVDVDFKEYVKGVLPNEWGPRWNEESLKAGAVAIKMFALSMVERRGYVWDCNWSQVYDPTRMTEATNKAVDDTWDYLLVSNEGEIFTTYYDDYHRTCYIRGAYYNCMGQWDSLSYAEAGMNYEEILYLFYEDSSLIFIGNEEIPEVNEPLIELTLYVRFLKEEHKYE